MKYIKLLIVFLLFMNLTFISAEVVLNKSISKEIVYEGDIAEITLEIKNNGQEAVSGSIYDLPREFIEVLYEDSEKSEDIPPSEGNSNLQETFLTIPSGKVEVLSYQVKFFNIPKDYLNKDFKLSLATFIDSEGSEYYSNDVIIFLKTDRELVCNYNYKCEEGENHENCFQDCLSGAVDGLCDGLTDGRCDADCEIEEDKDCQETNYLIYWIVGGVLILLIILGIIIWRRKRQ